VPIDVHGSLDRAKDVSPFAEALIRRLREECVRLAHADDVPLLILPEDTRCRRCVCLPGTSPQQTRRTDQDSHSSANPRRLTVSNESGCLPPLRREHLRGLLLLVYPHRFSAHAAHTLPPWQGTMCSVGHCKRLRRNYPAKTLENRTPFQPR